MTKKTNLTTKQLAIKHGYRSGLEDSIAEELNTLGITYGYEPHKIPFNQPEKTRSYTPDFLIKLNEYNSFYIETKGIFTIADRQKHLWIKEQYPELDIRFIFTNANSKINKMSKTTYAMWCGKYGFKWASKHIPEEWLND
jgi:hypothetical protein